MGCVRSGDPDARNGRKGQTGDIRLFTCDGDRDGASMRRGIAELNGEGEVTGGTIIVRYGQNVRDVIERVKSKLDDLKSSLPPGVELVTTYDRSDLIDRSIDTLRRT